MIRKLNVLWRMRRRKPTFLSYNVTNRCNEKCPMCTVWRTEADELTIGEMERIFRDLRQWGISVVEISGGEPFLRQDIFAVFALLDRLGMLYTLNSNGTLISSETGKQLRGAKGLLQFSISLDSLDRERYALLRGRDALPEVLQNIDRLRAGGLAVPLKLNIAMSRINYQETRDVLRFAKMRGLYLSVFPVNQGGDFHHRCGNTMFVADAEERRQMSLLFRQLADLRRSGEPLWEYSGFYELASEYVLGRPVGTCDAGKLFLDLHADGRLAVCVDQAVLADLRTERMRDVENRIAIQGEQIGKCSRETPCCYTCTYNLSLSARHEAAFLAETLRVRTLRTVRERFRERNGDPSRSPGVRGA